VRRRDRSGLLKILLDMIAALERRKLRPAAFAPG
jgi:hypothetical protein